DHTGRRPQAAIPTKGSFPMKAIVALAAGLLLVAGSAHAERITELNGRHVQLHPTNTHAGFGQSRNANISYHNGPVIHQARVIPIFWGSSATWGTSGSPSALAQHVIDFFVQFGTNPEYNVITQYYDFGGSVQASALT